MKNGKIKTANIVDLLVILITLIIFYLFDYNYNIIFVANIVVCVLIVIKSKFSIFTLKTLLLNYVLMPLAFQYNTGASYGILEISGYTLHYGLMNVLVFIYNNIMYLYIINSKILNYEKEKQLKNISISYLSAYICSIIAMAASIIAFPSFSFDFSSRSVRFAPLLPGNAWNHITIVALIFAFPKLKESKLVMFSYLFCASWFLSHAERVDMIGIIFCILIVSAAKNIVKIDKQFIKKYQKYLKYALLIVIVVMVMVFIGEYRSNQSDISFERILRKILIQNTAADIGYVYNVSIIYRENNGLLYGKTYLTYIQKIIPLMSSKYNASNILRDRYNTPGGILILSEPYMNLGILGIILFELLEFKVLHIVLKGKRNIYYYIYLFLLATTFRVTWYGLEYIEKGLIYFIPIMYILTTCIDKRVKKNG